MASQRVLSTDSKSPVLGQDTEPRDAEPRDAALQDEDAELQVLLSEYVFVRAKEDKELNSQECVTFEGAHQIQSTSEKKIVASAIIGRALGGIGDQIDIQHQEAIRKLAQWSGPPEQAHEQFNEVAKNTFTDGQGGVKITPGRIIAILNYCYELCKTYTLQNVVAASLASFISTVAKWLYKYFIEAKLYEWLDKQGGWHQLVPFSGNNMTLFIGIGFIVIWAFSYFRGN